MAALAHGKMSNEQNTHPKIQKIQNSRIRESNPRLMRTQENVKEYGSLESALQGRTVDAETVSNETVCIEFKCSY